MTWGGVAMGVGAAVGSIGSAAISSNSGGGGGGGRNRWSDNPLKMWFSGNRQNDLGPFRDVLMNLALGQQSQRFETGGELQQSAQYVAPLSATEQSFIDMITAYTGSPTAAETAGTDYLGNVLLGRYLPGGELENPLLDPVLAGANRNIDRRRDSFLREAMGMTGGLAGAGSAVPALSLFEADSTDALNKILFGEYDRERNRMQAGLGMLPGINAVPVARMEAGLKAAGIPREIADEGKRRAYQIYQDRIDDQMRSSLAMLDAYLGTGTSSGFSGSQPSNLLGSGAEFGELLDEAGLFDGLGALFGGGTPAGMPAGNYTGNTGEIAGQANAMADALGGTYAGPTAGNFFGDVSNWFKGLL